MSAAYDGLNRLTSASESTNSSANLTVTPRFTQAFDYDQWGNRKINQAATTTSPDINKRDFTVNIATNRLGVPAGQSGALDYDDVGNLINDTYTETDPNKKGAMLYDSENKMTSAVNGSHKYRYNADGKRVRRIIASGGEFWMVYGIGGEQVAEYNASTGIPNTAAPSKEFGYRGGQLLVVAESTTAVKWLIQDHLGSTRMEIGVGGALSDVTRHDYLPFGEELAGTMRNVAYGYGGATNTKQKFTGYERDDETGLDYAQARMYASKQGRFTSVDPDGVGADVSEPQSWNGYAYCGNRPTVITDPSGLVWIQNTFSGDIMWWEGSRAQFEEAQKKYGAFNGWVVVDGKTKRITRSGTTNGQRLEAGNNYYLDPSGKAVNLGSDFDMTTAFINQMSLRATATKQAIALFGAPSLIAMGGGAVVGGSQVVLGFVYGSGITTLGLYEAGTAATSAGAVLNQLIPKDAHIFRVASQIGASAANTFSQNLDALGRALSMEIPGAQIFKIGQIGASPVWGSLSTRVGIAEVNGVTVVVKMVGDVPKILGPLP